MLINIRFSLTSQRTKASPLRTSARCGLLLFCLVRGAAAQSLTPASAETTTAIASSSLPDAPTPTPTSQSDDQETVTLKTIPIHVLKDQGAIWTSPLRVRAHDLKWLVPLAAATGAGIATDHHAMSSVVSHDQGFNNANVNASNVLIGSFLAAPVALYGVGHFKGNEHAREAGILTGEALVNGVVVEQGMKLVFWRERPTADNSRGRFFQGSAGVDSSFPSSHSVLAWSAAAVLADEYPSRWSQLGIYTLATGVSLTRVMGQEHFPTDVLIGSATGWLIGHYIYRTHRHPLASH